MPLPQRLRFLTRERDSTFVFDKMTEDVKVFILNLKIND